MTRQKQNSILKQLLRTGIKAETSFIEEQKIFMFNLFLLIATPFAIISLAINIASAYYVPAVLNIIQIITFTVGYWITFTQKGLHLRVWLLLVLCVVAIFAAYFYKNGGEYRLLVMLIAAVVLFDKKWQYLFFATIVSFIFVFIRIDDMIARGLADGALVANILKIFIPLFLFVMALFYFKHIYFRNLDQLERTNKELLIAKEQRERILNTVAHDLRSPIGNIGGLAKMLLTDNMPADEQKKFLQFIDHASHSALVLINDLLQNSDANVHQVSLKKCDFNELIEQWIPALQVKAREKNIRIQAELATQQIAVNIDSDRIERVITNLVNNAIKFSPEQSVITIHTILKNDMGLLIVKDQGIGIPSEKQDHVFDVFTHARRNGTAGEKSFGMGLSICKQIVEQHGGMITLESAEGNGTSFMVSLPLYHNLSAISVGSVN